jgi:hypothetical protein
MALKTLSAIALLLATTTDYACAEWLAATRANAVAIQEIVSETTTSFDENPKRLPLKLLLHGELHIAPGLLHPFVLGVPYWLQNGLPLFAGCRRMGWVTCNLR